MRTEESGINVAEQVRADMSGLGREGEWFATGVGMVESPWWVVPERTMRECIPIERNQRRRTRHLDLNNPVKGERDIVTGCWHD